MIDLLAFAVAVGGGLLVKGPIAAVASMLAVGGQLFHTKAWGKLTDRRLVLVPIVIGVMLFPMCIGLYEQFGVHGLRFYFWEQSFGRITGENRWVDDSSILFFTHELPWQVLPWVLFILAGIRLDWKDLVGERNAAEHASTIGASLVFVALSLSQFKLPHYLYVTLPLFSIMGARALHRVTAGPLVRAHYLILFLLWILAVVFAWVVFPDGSWPFRIASILFPLLAVPYMRRVGSIQADGGIASPKGSRSSRAWCRGVATR